jgi:hypothetical protein
MTHHRGTRQGSYAGSESYLHKSAIAIISWVNDEDFPHQVLRRNQAFTPKFRVPLAFPSTSHAVLPTHLVSDELKLFHPLLNRQIRLFHMVAGLF